MSSRRKTGIDDADAAWNDTFVHPDSTHWLFEGDGLSFPGLTARVGVSGKTDVGVYLTKSPGANHGFFGAQVQHNLVENSARTWAASARVSFVFDVWSRRPRAHRGRCRCAGQPKAHARPMGRRVAICGVSTYLSSAHEKTAAVSLDDERVVGARGMVGATLELSKARLAAEYNVARVNSFSLNVGFGM